MFVIAGSSEDLLEKMTTNLATAVKKLQAATIHDLKSTEKIEFYISPLNKRIYVYSTYRFFGN